MAPRILQIAAFGALAASLAGAGVYAWWDSQQTYEAPARPVTAPRTAPKQAGAHPAPLELFADAKVGDWYAYRVVNAGSLGGIQSTVLTWVTAVDASTVTRTWRGRLDTTGDEHSGHPETFPRAGLTLERLDGDDIGGWTLADLAVTDDVHVVGDHRFACKKIAFASSDPMFARKHTHSDLWISAEVPAGGLVAKREEQHLDAMTFVITEELIGFGTASGTTWGTRPTGW